MTSRAAGGTKRMSTQQLRLLQGLSHPLRIFILGSLGDCSMTPKGLSCVLDVDTHIAAYHVNVLRDLELIRPVNEVPQPPDHDLAYEIVTPPFTSLLSTTGVQPAPWETTSGPLLQAMMEGGIAALEAGMFGGTNHLSHISAVLDDKGWQDVTSALSDSEERISRAIASAARRLADTGVDGVRVAIVLAGVSLNSEVDGQRNGGHATQPSPSD